MPVLFRHSRPPFVHSKIRVFSGIHYFSYFCRKKIVFTCLNRLDDAVVTIIHNLFCKISQFVILHFKVAVRCIGVVSS